jgi:hypothetical protein
MLNKLSWQSLENRITDARLLMFYKIEHRLVATSIPPYVQPSLFSDTRTLFRQFPTPRNYYKYSSHPAIIVLWNSLPSELVQVPTLGQFKQGVTTLPNHD